MVPQWKATLRKESDGNTIVAFSLEGDRGRIQMEALAGKLDLAPEDLDFAIAAELRRRAKSCVISWRDDAGVEKAVEVQVVGGRITVSDLHGTVLALGDRVEGGIGDQDPEWLISHVRNPMCGNRSSRRFRASELGHYPAT